ncbi:MAG TPA: hypothetical protein VFN44_12950 [Solirubrobacteraceae bacterium]|nr:hypothetical protein [Solirubrobacteraceae bacterium]
MRTGGETKRKASLPATIGAWLRVWTPPRDVEVPPVPVRKLLIGGALLLVLAAGAAALIVPAIDDSKQRSAAADAREAAQRREANRRAQIAEQRPRTLDAAAVRPDAGAPDAQGIAARETLLRRTEAAISADARARAQAGELEGRPQGTDCEPYPKAATRADWPDRDLAADRGVYDCLVFVRAIGATETNIGGQLGYPFRAVLDFDRFRVVWCKTNPVPGERVVPDPRTVLELPKACRAA